MNEDMTATEVAKRATLALERAVPLPPAWGGCPADEPIPIPPGRGIHIGADVRQLAEEWRNVR